MKHTGGQLQANLSKHRGGQPRNSNSSRHKFYASGDTEQRPTATARRKVPTMGKAPQLSSPPVAAQGPDGPPQPAGPTLGKKQTAPLPSLADIARDLYRRQQQLAEYIADISTLGITNDDTTLTAAYIAAQSLYGQNSARLARIIHVNDELPKDREGNESMSDALNYALSEINRVKRKIKELADDRPDL